MLRTDATSLRCEARAITLCRQHPRINGATQRLHAYSHKRPSQTAARLSASRQPSRKVRPPGQARLRACFKISALQRASSSRVTSPVWSGMSTSRSALILDVSRRFALHIQFQCVQSRGFHNSEGTLLASAASVRIIVERSCPVATASFWHCTLGTT